MQTSERIKRLESELEKGSRTLSNLTAQIQTTQATCLRIEGALAILREIEQDERATLEQETING